MKRQGARIALILLALALVVAPQVSAQENFRVIEVEVVGNRIASESLILGVSNIHIGSQLTPTDVSETIRRLYGLGLFSNVQLEAEQTVGGIKVFIVVEELPKLSGIEITGNDKINDKDIKSEIGLGVGGYISPNLVHKSVDKIKKLYAEKGYFQAAVEADLDYSVDSTEALLKLAIDEKDKVKVENVVIGGLERTPADDLVGKMRNRKRGLFRTSDFAQDEYDEDLEKVIAELHKRGFIDAYLVDDSIAIDQDRNRMTIYLEVYEGPQYYFGDVTFANNEKLPDEFLQSKLKYTSGDVFNQEKYEESLFEISSAYYDIGHLHIDILDERTTRSDSIIDVKYAIAEGLPSSIRLVHIKGNTKTRDHVIRRELSTLPGRTFSRQLLIRSVRDVMALNYFANVVPTPVNLPNGDVDIEFEVEEKQTAQVSAGAGYNSRDKLVGNVGLGIPNFRGMGQNLSFSVDFGSRRNSFQATFTEPWMFGRPTLLGISGFALNRRWFDDYTEARQGGSIRIGRRLRWPDNFFRVFANVSMERTRYYDFSDPFEVENSYKKFVTTFEVPVKDEDDVVIPDSTVTVGPTLDRPLGAPYPGSILNFENWNDARSIGFTIRRDSRNLPEFATSGSDFQYTFENTGGVLGGHWEYQKHQFSASYFIPLWRGIAFAAKAEYGVVTTQVGDDKILISDRFTPGGTAYDGVIRGYDDGSLTPDSLITQGDTIFYYTWPDTAHISNPGAATADSVQSTGSFRTRVRGKHMFVTNLELQIPLVPQQIYVLAFLDGGRSWLHRENMKLGGLYWGTGVGFRIAIPGMGTLGFDFGYPLVAAPNQERKWRPHFQIGSVFR